MNFNLIFKFATLDGQLGLGYANGPNQTKFCLVEMLVGFPAALITAGTDEFKYNFIFVILRCLKMYLYYK